MENKLYTFIISLLLSSFLPAHAQDSTKCNARFTTLQNAGSNAVYFTAVDSVPSARHFWNFGDSIAPLSGAGYSVRHNYSHPGTYVVTHVVRDSVKGCSDSSVQLIPVNLSPSCSLLIVVTPDSTNYNLYNLYVAYPSVVTDGADTITWYDNDSLIGTGFNLFNHYFRSGFHTIRAELAAPQGCHASATQNIRVISACQSQVSFTHQADPGDPELIHFAPVPATDDSAVYNWDFAGLSSSSVKNPSYRFPYANIFNVTLTVTRRSGTDSCRSVFSQYFYVNSIPDTCHFTVNISHNPANNGQVTFSIHNNPPADSVIWYVHKPGDSINVLVFQGNPATHMFADSGCYNVSATVITKTCNGYTDESAFCIDSSSATTVSNIAAYPNPATNQAILELNLTTPNTIRIDIYNSMGRQIQTEIVAGYAGINQVTIPTASLPKGVYYVRIHYGNEVRNSKIQKL